MWGQVDEPLMDIYSHRIIPTRVGTSAYRYLQAENNQDHPHACGDKLSEMYPKAPSLGSSPRVWGQAIGCVIVFCILGIIPTRVGTSELLYYHRQDLQDHPHACGDKL